MKNWTVLIWWLIDIDPATGIAFVQSSGVTTWNDRYKAERKAVVDFFVVDVLSRAAGASEDFAVLTAFQWL
jgi:hypothetical protein